jgi:hypothetical protein
MSKASGKSGWHTFVLTELVSKSAQRGATIECDVVCERQFIQVAS